MNESEKHFSLTRAASSKADAKKQFPITLPAALLAAGGSNKK
jgi:hypothetical protein